MTWVCISSRDIYAGYVRSPPSPPLSPSLPTFPPPPIPLLPPCVYSLARCKQSGRRGANPPPKRLLFHIKRGPKNWTRKIGLKRGAKKREARFFYSGRWLKNECYSNLYAVIKGNSVLSSIAIPGGENRMRVRRVLSHEHSPLWQSELGKISRGLVPRVANHQEFYRF